MGAGKIGRTLLCLLMAFAVTGCGGVRQNDTGNGAGNGERPPSNVTADTEAPLILPESLKGTIAAGTAMQVLFSVSDDQTPASDIYTEVIVLNAAGVNVTASTYTADTQTFKATAAGTYSIIIEAYDLAGNCGTLTHTVVVTPSSVLPPEKPEPEPDTQKPQIVLGTMADTIELGDYLTVRFTVRDDQTEESDIYTEVKILTESGADVTKQTYSATTKRFTPAAAGAYRVQITARDLAGNEQTATHAVRVLSAAAALPSNPNLPADQAYGDVSVHDPSVFYDPVGKKYYAYGSHFAIASSTDMMRWNFVSDTPQAVFGKADWRSVLTKAAAFAGGTQNTWAPDVEYHNGKYYMYFSLTSGFGSNKSFIGRVASDSPTGPFDQDETMIITSDGKSGSPNAIDPELFYDKNGGLWMVYGSFFTGIYMKELYASGSNWGLPKESGYGKKVWLGSGNGPEGPFAFYNEQTDYYYLIASYGELSHNYNMCVARSKNPDGPYLDAAGRDVALVQGGNKLAGNYKFEGGKTYAALGHNSVCKTADGKYLNVFHTRYALGTAANPGAHNLRVHQLFFDYDGWPVMSPSRYAGETAGRVTAAQAAGNYDVVVHSAEKNADTIVASVPYTLQQDGRIAINGVAAGSWQLKDDNHITLTVNGTAYSGVIVPSWCSYKNKAVFAITALSANGVSLWGNGV